MLITVMVVAYLVLKEFRAALGAMYGDRIERAVLFGSRAACHIRAYSGEHET